MNTTFLELTKKYNKKLYQAARLRSVTGQIDGEWVFDDLLPYYENAAIKSIQEANTYQEVVEEAFNIFEMIIKTIYDDYHFRSFRGNKLKYNHDKNEYSIILELFPQWNSSKKKWYVLYIRNGKLEFDDVYFNFSVDWKGERPDLPISFLLNEALFGDKISTVQKAAKELENIRGLIDFSSSILDVRKRDNYFQVELNEFDAGYLYGKTDINGKVSSLECSFDFFDEDFGEVKISFDDCQGFLKKEALHNLKKNIENKLKKH